jgi:hypothetical protein
MVRALAGLVICYIAAIPASVSFAIGLAGGVWLCAVGILKPRRWTRG